MLPLGTKLGALGPQSGTAEHTGGGDSAQCNKEHCTRAGIINVCVYR